jgi:hypothetical protein
VNNEYLTFSETAIRNSLLSLFSPAIPRRFGRNLSSGLRVEGLFKGTVTERARLERFCCLIDEIDLEGAACLGAALV